MSDSIKSSRVIGAEPKDGVDAKEVDVKNGQPLTDNTQIKVEPNSFAKEINGPKGLEPTRYGDWESKGRCYDF